MTIPIAAFPELSAAVRRAARPENASSLVHLLLALGAPARTSDSFIIVDLPGEPTAVAIGELPSLQRFRSALERQLGKPEALLRAAKTIPTTAESAP